MAHGESPFDGVLESSAPRVGWLEADPARQLRAAFPEVRLLSYDSAMIPARLVRELAEEAGFDLVRFGPATPGDHGERFASWLDAGRAGSMDYLHRNRARILEPSRWAKDPRGAVCLAFDYGRPAAGLPSGGRIARYAVGRDYHRVLGNAVRRIRQRLEREGVPPGTIKIGTDAVPVLERALAMQSGIGFLAKSAGVISPTQGPYLLLAELLTPFELPADTLAPGSCGSCTRCLDACPTGAIVAPFEVDARRCLSYTTIELRGPIPVELRQPQGDWLFGCDVCLEVCPFTSKGQAAKPQEPGPLHLGTHPVIDSYTLVGVLELSEAEWQQRWVGTAMRRATRSGLRRNAAVVLGNLGDQQAIPALVRALDDPDPIVRGHAAWALGQLAPGAEPVRAALTREPDEYVRGELRAALMR